jgi:hypothetical protein
MTERAASEREFAQRSPRRNRFRRRPQSTPKTAGTKLAHGLHSAERG